MSEYRFELVDEVPEGADVKPGVLYVELNTDPEQTPFLAALLCPCGCGHAYKLPLQSFDTRPRWAFSAEGIVPTLSPSIVHLSGCKAHFFLTDGKIIWC